MLLSLAAGGAAGRVLGMPGLTNVATSFGALWAAEKWVELSQLDVNFFVLVLGGSVATWRGALWLHAHPEFVVSLMRALQPAA